MSNGSGEILRAKEKLFPAQSTQRSETLRQRWFEGKNLAFTVILALIMFLVFYPILLLFINSFKVGAYGQETFWGLDNWIQAFQENGLRSALINTITMSLIRQIIALVLGIILAWILARTDLPGRNWLEFGFWIAFFLPSLPMTLSWILLFDPDKGAINQLFAAMPFLQFLNFNIFSYWGIIWVHLATTTVAVKVMLLTPAFRNMDNSLEEASRTCGASTIHTFTRVLIPVMAPIILVVTIMGLIHALESFEIELILGAPEHINVYSTLIYHLIYQQPPNYGSATVLGTVILLLMLPFILFQQWVTRQGGHATVTGKYNGQLFRLGKWRWPLCAVITCIVLMITVFPLIVLIAGTLMKYFGRFTIPSPWTWKHWMEVLDHPVFLNALKNTLVLAFGTAILSILFLSVIAYIIVRTKYSGKSWLDFFSWLPISLPGVVIGLGMLWLFLGTKIFNPIYGTIFILILATFLAQMTRGVQVFKSNFVQLGNELEEASKVNGASWLYTFRRVILPIISPSVAVVGIMAFATAARTTSHVALLSTSDTQPLSILQLNYMADGSYEAASVIGVITLVLTLGVALIARLFGLKLRG